MRIWTIVVVCLCYYCSVLVGGQLQISMKGISGDKTIKQDDNSNKQLSQLSTFRHELDGGNHESIVQQSFALNAEDETRRLGTTQVKFFYVFLSRSCILLLFNP